MRRTDDGGLNNRLGSWKRRVNIIFYGRTKRNSVRNEERVYDMQ